MYVAVQNEPGSGPEECCRRAHCYHWRSASPEQAWLVACVVAVAGRFSLPALCSCLAAAMLSAPAWHPCLAAAELSPAWRSPVFVEELSPPASQISPPVPFFLLVEQVCLSALARVGP